MSKDLAELQHRLDEAEARIQSFERNQRLATELDEALELGLKERHTLERGLDRAFPILLRHTGAAAAFARTFDEDLKMRDFLSGSLPAASELDPEIDRLLAAKSPETMTREDETWVGQPLDVAGDPFGGVGLFFDRKLSAEAIDSARTLLTTWCELLDNHLAFIALSRLKHRLTLQTSEALREPILDEGINRALEVLRAEVSYRDMLLVFRQEDDLTGESIHYKVVQNGRMTHDSETRSDLEVDEFIRSRASGMIQDGSRDLLDRLDISHFREEVLITGVRDQRVLGRLVVTSERGEFNTFERDLLERFADFLRQRIVDYNREYRHLSLCFPRPIAERLLHEPEYRARHLEPSEHEVAILYADISGFTRVSEQVLKEPSSIGKLIDTWSEAVVDIIWDKGGVFDKMVGDCVIAMWGPPFYDKDPDWCCRTALEAAESIREYTRTLNDGVELPELAGLDEPVGVAIGLNYCPALVGYFGPNDDYTAFSAGMNNTARLQGVAVRDQILCMDSFAKAMNESKRFGELLSVKVKNVADALVYRAVL